MFTVAPHCQIMTQLGSKDSSRNLHVTVQLFFFFYPHLILHVCVQTFDVMFLAKKFWDLNKARPLHGYVTDQEKGRLRPPLLATPTLKPRCYSGGGGGLYHWTNRKCNRSLPSSPAVTFPRSPACRFSSSGAPCLSWCCKPRPGGGRHPP